MTPTRTTRPYEPAAVKTHCKRGHEYTEANTYVTPQGQRQCRRCNEIYKSKYLKRKQENTDEQ